MKAHLFVSSTDGALYDTRVADWSKRPPLRANYKRHGSNIDNAADFKAALRAGPYVWPGGYPVFFIMADGTALSFKAAKQEAKLILSAMMGDPFEQWRVVWLDVNYEDTTLRCVHTGERIEAAYADS